MPGVCVVGLDPTEAIPVEFVVAGQADTTVLAANDARGAVNGGTVGAALMIDYVGKRRPVRPKGLSSGAIAGGFTALVRCVHAEGHRASDEFGGGERENGARVVNVLTVFEEPGVITGANQLEG